MTGDISEEKETEELDDIEDSDDSEDRVVAVDEDDSEMTAEVNVEELVSKIDAQSASESDHKKAVKRRLDELAERRSEMADLDSTYNFNLDDDL